MTTSATTSAAPKKGLTSRLIGFIIPLVITVGLCWLLFHDIDMSQMWDIIRHECDFFWIGLNLSLTVLAQIWRALRWRIQLRAIGVCPTVWQLILSIFGTYSVNLVFPRLGEVWRTGYITERTDSSFSEVFGSMVAERLSDTVAVALFMLATLVASGPQMREYLSQDPDKFDFITSILCSPILWGAIVATLIAAFWIFTRYPENKVVKFVNHVWHGLWAGFSSIWKMPGKGKWLLLTVLLWGSYFAGLYCAFRSFPLTSKVLDVYRLQALLVCYVFTSISMAVPSNGGIGPWQWAMIFGLSFYMGKVPELTTGYASSFANLVMGTQTMMQILLGIFTFTWIALVKRTERSSQCKVK